MDSNLILHLHLYRKKCMTGQSEETDVEDATKTVVNEAVEVPVENEVDARASSFLPCLEDTRTLYKSYPYSRYHDHTKGTALK